jgi:transcriptional regulator with XRE-family HTH domain
MTEVTRVKLNNPKILTWAREELGLSESEVAKRFKKTPDIICAWENGDELPTFRQLIDLASFYKRPVPLFFLPVVPPKSSKHKIR